MGAADVARTIKQKDNNNSVYLSGYHMLGGMATSMIIAVTWDALFGHEKSKIKVGVLTGEPIKNVGDGIDLDKVIMMGISAGLTMAELFGGVKGAASAGAGIVLGYSYFNTSNQGSYIGQLK